MNHPKMYYISLQISGHILAFLHAPAISPSNEHPCTTISGYGLLIANLSGNLKNDETTSYLKPLI